MAVAKLERQLTLIAELLETERPLTSAQLRERIEGYPEDRDSFKRAFERDKKDLREMGIPIQIDTVPGSQPPEDGYRIDSDEYAFPDPGLDGDEMAALQVAATAVRLEGTDADAGLRKLRGLAGFDDLNAPAVGDAGTVPTMVIASAPHLDTIWYAVAHRRELRFRYRDRDRVVDPARLGHQRGHWYLRAFDRGVEAPRSFRVDRIVGEISTGEPGSAEVRLDQVDAALDLDAWALGEDEAVPAQVRVRPPQARLAARSVGDPAKVVWEDDGSVVLDIQVRNTDGFRSFVLGFLDAAEILSPETLRHDLQAWLTRIVESDGAPEVGSGG